MITCPKCGNQISDGSKFCKRCGNRLLPLNAQNSVQTNFTQAPAQTESNKKSSDKKYIYAIIALILVIAIIAGGWLIFDLKKSKNSEYEQKLREMLEESTTKPVVEFMFNDFDKNGTFEAFAVVGKTDNKNAEHPEYYDADICYVNEDDVQVIKESVSGKSNGTITVGDNIYVSLEVYEDGTEEGYSFIYTADDDTFEEPDISGKYSDVHEEDGKIIAIDDGDEIELDITDGFKEVTTENKSVAETTTSAETATSAETTTSETTTKKSETTTKTPAPISEGTIIEPNESDWKNLNGFISSCDDSSVRTFDCNSSDARKKAYEIMYGGTGNMWVYDTVSGYSDEYKGEFRLNSDPLGKFDLLVSRYPAEKVDWVIKNVFNIDIDRSFSDKNCYYYGNYYYQQYIEAGGGIFDCNTTHSSIGNGKYKTETKFTDPESGHLYYTTTATVALKSVDGKRVWSLYTYNKSDFNPNY